MVSKSISNIIKRYPDRCAVIVILDDKIIKNTQSINKIHKYLIPTDMTFGAFSHLIRTKISLDKTHGLFFFIENTLPIMSDTIGKLYTCYKQNDDIMYINTTIENTFG